MNKSELIAKVADTTNEKRTVVGPVVDAVFDAIVSELKKGGDIRLTGFGTFDVMTTKGGEARNPKTGEKVVKPPMKKARFKAGKALKDELN